jgi:phosphate starvation-inducible PhoH-like protein
MVKLLRELKPKTVGQEEYIRAIAENEITLSEGPAGSGKTHIAAGLAC